MPRCRLLILSALVVSLPAGAAKGYHLWYDENGQAVYSQLPPPDGRQSQTLKGPPPPAESPEAARQRLERRLQEFEDRREDQDLARQRADQAANEAAARQQRCEAARRQLEGLTGRPRQLFRSSDGTVRRLTEEERQEQRAEMQKVIAENCDN